MATAASAAPLRPAKKRAVNVYPGWTAVLLAVLRSPFALPMSPPSPPLQPPSNPLRHADATEHPRLRSVLDAAASDLDRLFPDGSRTPPRPPWRETSLDYGIFRGRSALRDLPTSDDASDLPLDPADFFGAADLSPAAVDALRRASAVLLLLRGRSDAAHESVLGVGPSNLDDAEYAAMHPGETSWSADHPLATSDDVIHAACHRLEGSRVGEGGHVGYDNAKFWAAGGPKMLDGPADHPVRRALADRARRGGAPGCVRRWGVVAPAGGAEHDIIAGGGRRRTVRVPEGEWDSFAFVDLCRWVRERGGDEDSGSGNGNGGGDDGNGDLEVPTEEDILETMDLQRFELMELLQVELQEAGLLGVSDETK